jgi:ATP-dependent DNA helicase RecQ
VSLCVFVAPLQPGIGKTKCFYVAPETLIKEDNVEFFKTLNISFFAVDEAHCISEWGHILGQVGASKWSKLNPTAPMIALTATATQSAK